MAGTQTGTRTGTALAVPAVSSGSLDVRSVPDPQSLGQGWAPFIDPGSAADGYLGNGSFVREREGAELLASLLPLGCADAAPVPALPRPEHALEATYRHEDGSAAVVIALVFADEDAARSLLRELGDVVSACPVAPGPAGAQGPSPLVIDVTRRDEEELHDVRRESGSRIAASRWVEVAVREQQRVSLAMIEVGPDAADPDVHRLALSLRAALPDF
jgi:hypothetical protein